MASLHQHAEVIAIESTWQDPSFQINTVFLPWMIGLGSLREIYSKHDSTQCCPVTMAEFREGLVRFAKANGSRDPVVFKPEEADEADEGQRLVRFQRHPCTIADFL